MSLAQWCTDQLQPHRPFPWLLAVRICRTALLHWSAVTKQNSTVNFWWGWRWLSLPFSHDLPLYKAFTPLYDEPLRWWIQRISSRSARPLRIINIGANVGDTYCLLQETGNHHVLLVEGDAQYLPFLYDAVQGDPFSHVLPTYIGDGAAAGEISAHSTRGTTRLQTTSPHKSGQKNTTLPTLEKLLQQKDRRPWQRADFVVVDTDGFDWAVLRGAGALLDHRPTLFFEYYPVLWQLNHEDPVKLWAWLDSKQYRTVWLYRNTGEFLGRFSLVSDQVWLSKLPELLPQLDRCPYLDVVVQ